MSTPARRSSYGYSKLDKEDPEEVMHRRAQSIALIITYFTSMVL
jgi:hypothetical protein